MKLIKKIVLALLVAIVVASYPLVCNSKSQDSKRVVLKDDNTVSLYGEISSDSVAQVILQLQKLDSKTSLLGKKKPIYLFVYSPGGDIQAGLEMIEAVHGLNRPVDTVTLFAASMAFETVENLGDRLALKSSVFMAHRAAGGFEGYFGGNRPSQLDSRYNFWLQRLTEMDEQVVSRTNGKQTLKSFRDSYENESWLTGTQAVEEGYADSLVSVHCDESLNGTTTHQLTFMGMNISYDTANCPLITTIMNIKVTSPDGKVLTSPTMEEVRSKFIEQMDLQKSVK